MANTADIKNGMCIEHNGDIVRIIEFSKFQVGRGSGKVWTKMKSSTSGRITEHTYNSGAAINEVRVERRKFQFLYKDGDQFQLMNQETYDQVNIDADMVENGKFLKEGDIVDVLYNAANDMILTVELPQTLNMKITYCEPGMKGDTATNTLKPATVESGAEVRVPLFCEEGDIIKVDTATGSYIERVKK